MDIPMTPTCEAFRIVRLKGLHPHTLFHALPGKKRSTCIPLDEWIQAEIKAVSYGKNSPFMDSGFNVLLSKKETETYINRFKYHCDLLIVQCRVAGLQRKPRARGEVYLAEWQLVRQVDFQRAYNQKFGNK